MATKTTKPALSAQQLKMMKTVRDSGAVDFDRLGKLVAKVGPQVFDPGLVATDYIATGYSSVIKVWETGSIGALNEVADLKKVAPAVAAPKARAKIALPTKK